MSNFVRGNGYWIFSAALVTFSLGWIFMSRVPEARAGETLASPREGFYAPAIELPKFDGETLSLNSLRGKVVIVNLWASWCGPCRAEMPALEAVYRANGHRGLEVLAVNSTVQDSVQAARLFADELGLTFPIVLDVDGSVSRRYLLRALPTTFIVDRQGIIRSVLVGGPISQAVLMSKVEPLLQESP